MEQVLLVVQVLVAGALIGIILIQRSDTDGFGLGSGSGMNLLSGRSAANLLTRTTAVLATLFIINSLVLSIIAARTGHRSIVEQIEQQQSTAPAPVIPATKDAAPAVTPKPADKKIEATTPPAKVTTEKKAPVVPAAQ